MYELIWLRVRLCLLEWGGHWVTTACIGDMVYYLDSLNAPPPRDVLVQVRQPQRERGVGEDADGKGGGRGHEGPCGGSSRKRGAESARVRVGM